MSGNVLCPVHGEHANSVQGECAQCLTEKGLPFDSVEVLIEPEEPPVEVPPVEPPVEGA
jgi:hypothetical protein